MPTSRPGTTDDYVAGSIDLTGNASGNVVRGNNGNNVINGGDGNDELTGRGGEDSFLFDTALERGVNIDVVTDFDVADDTILLDDDIFSSGLGLGNISAGEFVIGPRRSTAMTASSTTTSPAPCTTTPTTRAAPMPSGSRR